MLISSGRLHNLSKQRLPFLCVQPEHPPPPPPPHTFWTEEDAQPMERDAVKMKL
ncbi:hypothetical protein JOB18_031470 [Solea senegalensis]|uniref:Uncharacterized protein n=1 Tax=Solea senegalensis TaxID=28829 RepID=A0AAV6RNK2_SOLSE|nr:hypothetical protein JOB18_031470 [Solea senegalensis]